MVKRLVGICAGPLITALTGCMGKGEEECKAVNKSSKLHHMTVMWLALDKYTVKVASPWKFAVLEWWRWHLWRPLIWANGIVCQPTVMGSNFIGPNDHHVNCQNCSFELTLQPLCYMTQAHNPDVTWLSHDYHKCFNTTQTYDHKVGSDKRVQAVPTSEDTQRNRGNNGQSKHWVGEPRGINKQESRTHNIM